MPKKGSNVLSYAEAKWKASKKCSHSLVGGHISLDFVPVVYDLIELIIETSPWSMDYSTFDSHTQHISLRSIMPISFVWLYMFKCDVYAQILVAQTQKCFWVFYMFLKVILYFLVFSFCSKCFSVLKNSKTHKNWKIFKMFDHLFCVCHMWVWPSTFVLMA